MSQRRVIFGLLLIVLGVLLFGRALDLFWFSFSDFWGTIFPILLIGLGIWLIVRKKRHEDRAFDHHGVHVHVHTDDTFAHSDDFAQHQAAADSTTSAHASHGPTADAAGRIRYSKGLGDLNIDGTGLNLRNVEVSCGIGDLEIKLHGAVLGSGLNRLIVSSFIGDIRIFVPPEIPYFAHCSNFIGDVEMSGRKESGFSNTVDGQSDDYESAEDKLYISVSSFIGDVKIYRI